MKDFKNNVINYFDRFNFVKKDFSYLGLFIMLFAVAKFLVVTLILLTTAIVNSGFLGWLEYYNSGIRSGELTLKFILYVLASLASLVAIIGEFFSGRYANKSYVKTIDKLALEKKANTFAIFGLINIVTFFIINFKFGAFINAIITLLNIALYYYFADRTELMNKPGYIPGKSKDNSDINNTANADFYDLNVNKIVRNNTASVEVESEEGNKVPNNKNNKEEPKNVVENMSKDEFPFITPEVNSEQSEDNKVNMDNINEDAAFNPNFNVETDKNSNEENKLEESKKIEDKQNNSNNNLNGTDSSEKLLSEPVVVGENVEFSDNEEKNNESNKNNKDGLN